MSGSHFQAARMGDCPRAASYAPGEKEKQRGHEQLLGGAPENLRELKGAFWGKGGWCLAEGDLPSSSKKTDMD